MAIAMKNPVFLGCAATNRPHVRLREHPLSTVEINGKKYIRVPMMKKGLYNHPTGQLDMNDATLNAFIENHQKHIADYGAGLDPKHQPELGMLGWFEADRGGFLQRESSAKPLEADPTGDLLVGYADPTGDDALQAIENGKFRYASMEFHPNYRSNLVQTYLSEDLSEVEMTENIQLAWKSRFGGMAKKAYKAADRPFAMRRKIAGAAFNPKKSLFAKGAKAYGKATKSNFGRVKRGFGKMRRLEVEENITLNQLFAIHDALVEYQEQGQEGDFLFLDPSQFDLAEFELPQDENGFYQVDAQTAEEMLAALDELAEDEDFAHLFVDGEDDDEEGDEIPEPAYDEGDEELDEHVSELEARLQAYENQIIALQQQNVENWVQATIAEAKTKGHPAVMLNTVEALMLGNTIGSIKLEDETDAASIASYYRQGLAKLLQVTPAKVNTDSRTQPDKTVALESTTEDLVKAGEEFAKSTNFWSKI